VRQNRGGGELVKRCQQAEPCGNDNLAALAHTSHIAHVDVPVSGGKEGGCGKEEGGVS
jgi:hypothetical protein